MRRILLPLCAGVCLLCLAVLAGQSAAPAGKTKPVEELLKAKFKRPAVNTTLAKALKDLSKLTDVKVTVDWPSLLETGVSEETKVSLAPAEATLEQLIEQVLARVAKKGKPLSWYMVNATVCVTTQARVLGRGRFLGVPAAGTPAASKGEATAKTDKPAVLPRRGVVREFSFDKAPLGDVVAFLRQVSGVNFHVNYGALELVGVTKDTPISLKVSNVSVARALNLITEQLSAAKNKYDSVYWIVDEGVVKITSGTALDATLQTRVYDVADLLMVVPNMEAPRINLDATNQSSDRSNNSSSEGLFNTDNDNDTNKKDDRTTSRKELEENLIKIVKDTIGEDMWQPQGKGAVRIMRNMMIISQTRLGFLMLQKSAGIK
ncbi:MAG TPA: hypothetical protein VNA25_17995 [Phycisphaerae bacterium]|nr:hypothetical protein [Phycisphaerae bacterium]HUT59743.1 hypothetical protein [Phycisphaerae bacterium]